MDIVLSVLVVVVAFSCMIALLVDTYRDRKAQEVLAQQNQNRLHEDRD